MSTGKLDQSLDDIVKTNRPRRTVRHRRVVQTTKTAAPVGGVSKKTKPAKSNKAATVAAQAVAKNQPAIPTAGKDSKCLVSGLPSDILEADIKKYFSNSIGKVKAAHLTYGPNGQSRGIATVVFADPKSAVTAAQNLNGVVIDGTKKLRVEVIVSADKAPVPVPAKGLSDRIAQSKNQPKKANAKPEKKAAPKPATKATGRKEKAAKGRTARPKRKTAEELDAEMTDYFGPGSTVTGQENVVATNGDAGMTDEVM